MEDQAIIELFRDLKETMSERIRGDSTLTRATIKAEINRIDEKMDGMELHDQIQNGRLDTIEKQTSIWRFVQRNPVLSIIGGFILIIGVGVVIGIDIEGEKIMHIFKNIKSIF